jgi:vancomycin resistance protein YoaR
MQKSFLFTIPLFLSVSASAQVLPAPAPQPVKPAAKATPTPDPLLIEDPLPSEAPIIIGEPVRHQSGMGVPSKTSPARTTSVAPPPRASVAGVSIVGLSDGNAVAKMRAALEPQLKAPVRLVIGGYQYTFLREELGVTLPLWPMMREARRKNGDAPLRLQVDQDKVIAALKELDIQVRQDFEDTALNVGASAARVKLGLETTPIPTAIPLVTMPLPKAELPAPKAPEVEPAKDNNAPSNKFPYLVASFSTRYDAGLRGRTTNLKMAAQNIDGTIVAPGRVFSTNQAIGPRNAAAGWREAKMFVSGQVVSGTGAGICQAASTLYNAALLADLPIVERHAHSMRVMYVPPSRDAALMWGSKDFKFRNTTGGALRVQTWVAGGKFHVNLWGAKPRTGAPVQITSRVLSREGGTRSEAFKLVGGQKIRLSRDSYKPHP